MLYVVKLFLQSQQVYHSELTTYGLQVYHRYSLCLSNFHDSRQVKKEKEELHRLRGDQFHRCIRCCPDHASPLNNNGNQHLFVQRFAKIVCRKENRQRINIAQHGNQELFVMFLLIDNDVSVSHCYFEMMLVQPRRLPGGPPYCLAVKELYNMVSIMIHW